MASRGLKTRPPDIPVGNSGAEHANIDDQMQRSAPGTDSAQRTADLEAEVARLTRLLQLKDEHIRLLNLRLFGPKSEKLSNGQMNLLLDEASLTAGEVDQGGRASRSTEAEPAAPRQATPPQPSGTRTPARAPGAPRGDHSLLPGGLPLCQVRSRTTAPRLRAA